MTIEKNSWIVEVDHTAASGKGYTMKTVLGFKEAKAEADRISKRDDVYLVSLYKFNPRIYHVWGHKEPRAYIQRNGGKIHSANSAYYKQYESSAYMTNEFMAKLQPFS